MKFLFILVLTPIVFGWVSDQDLQAFTDRLLYWDVNNAAQYVHINYQGHTKFPRERLLTIDSQAPLSPTISKLRLLYDNYICNVSMKEHVTLAEQDEEDSLLDSFMDTPVMKYTMNFLAYKGFIYRDTYALKALLKHIWFTMYSRGGSNIGSSGFEHVFLGELDGGVVKGMHNWVFFGTEEEKKEVNILHVEPKIVLEGKGVILELHYNWVDVMKPVSSMFVGTSPELEMALYTVCFLVHPDEKCQVRMAGKHFSIRTHTYRYRSKNMIGSAFPEI